MRKIERIFVHCTASLQEGYTDEKLMAEFKRKGWKAPGYHYVVRPDGSVFNMYPISKISNGVAGYNATAINVAYVGGIDKEHPKGIDNRTKEQKESLRALLTVLQADFPDAIILGHRDISPDKDGNGVIDPWEYIKACPCFDALKEYASIGLYCKATDKLVQPKGKSFKKSLI